MKLNTRRTFLVGLAFLSICAFWQAYDSLVPLMLKNTFHMGDTQAGFIMSLDNILALFLLPFFGALSDRCTSRLGRRMPFIVGGTLAASVLTLLLPAADRAENLTFFIVVLGLLLIAMGVYRSPAVALMPDVTPKPLRSKANAIINLMGAVGGLFALVCIRLLLGEGTHPDYFPIFLAVAVLMLVSVAVLFLTIRERKLAAETAALDHEASDDPSEKTDGASSKKAPMDPAVKKSLIFLLCSVALWFMGYNAVTTSFSKYVQVQLGITGGGFASCVMVGTVAAIASYLPVGMVSSRLGRKKVILFGAALLAAALVGGFLLSDAMVVYKNGEPAVSLVANGLFVLVGIGWASINVNSYPMVVEMSKGSDVGKYTGFYYTFSMAAQIVTPILSGFFLEHVGYWTLFPYGALFVAASFVTMCFVRHGDNRPAPPASALEAFEDMD